MPAEAGIQRLLLGHWIPAFAGMTQLDPLALADVAVLARQHDAGPSALSPQPYLLFHAGDTHESETIGAWLRHMSVPTLCIAGKSRDDAITRASDVVLQEAAQAARLVANIGHSPMAAAVLVQVLRATEHLPVLDALTVESLAYATLQSGPEFRRWLADHRPPALLRPDQGAPVLLDRAGDELSIVLNRPDERNAISVGMRDALVEAFDLVATDTSILRVRVSGRGKCFSIGGDLAEFGTVPDPLTGHIVRSLVLPARHLVPAASRTEFHLHGACIGAGIELPAFAGRVTAAANTFFELPELSFGLIPGAGGCVSIPRRVGRQRASWLALSGVRIGADEALSWGLVDAVE